MIIKAWKMVDEYNNSNNNTAAASAAIATKTQYNKRRTISFGVRFLWTIFFFCCVFFVISSITNRMRKKPDDGGINSNEKHRNFDSALQSLLRSIHSLAFMQIAVLEQLLPNQPNTKGAYLAVNQRDLTSIMYAIAQRVFN